MQTDYGKLLADPKIGVVLCDESVLPFNAYVSAVLDTNLAKEKYDNLKAFETEVKKTLLAAVQSRLNPLLQEKGLESLAEPNIHSFSTGLLAYLFEQRKR